MRRSTVRLSEDVHVSYRFDVPENIPDRNIDMERRQAIYLVFKEALHNILRHADARSVDIRAAFNGSSGPPDCGALPHPASSDPAPKDWRGGPSLRIC
jgi:hypothetical protein